MLWPVKGPVALVSLIHRVGLGLASPEVGPRQYLNGIRVISPDQAGVTGRLGQTGLWGVRGSGASRHQRDRLSIPGSGLSLNWDPGIESRDWDWDLVNEEYMP